MKLCLYLKNKKLFTLLLFLGLLSLTTGLLLNSKEEDHKLIKSAGNDLDFITFNSYKSKENRNNDIYKEEIIFDDNSKDITVLNEEQVAKINTHITNKSNTSLYYRTFIFDGFGRNKNNLSNVSNCTLYNENTDISNEIEITQKVRERTIMVKVYSSSFNCLKDSDSFSNDFVSEKTKKIGLKSKIYNYSNEWKLLNFDYDGIKRNIGVQAPMLCHDYALAYGVYIISNGSKISTVFPRNSVCYGSDISKAGSMEQLYTIIKQKIDDGIPVSIHINNYSGGEHWVLVVGYKLSINPDDVSPSDFYVLDPGDLSYGEFDRTFRDTHYRTWETRDSAVACR